MSAATVTVASSRTATMSPSPASSSRLHCGDGGHNKLGGGEADGGGVLVAKSQMASISSVEGIAILTGGA